MVSRRATKAASKHALLNAIHANEAGIVAQLVIQRRSLVATNMAGRGTDIMLGVAAGRRKSPRWKLTEEQIAQIARTAGTP